MPLVGRLTHRLDALHVRFWQQRVITIILSIARVIRGPLFYKNVIPPVSLSVVAAMKGYYCNKN